MAAPMRDVRGQLSDSHDREGNNRLAAGQPQGRPVSASAVAEFIGKHPCGL